MLDRGRQARNRGDGHSPRPGQSRLPDLYLGLDGPTQGGGGHAPAPPGVDAARLQYYPEPVRRFLLLSPFTFESPVAGVFWTLAQGGTLVLPKASASDVTAVVEDIERLGVSHTLCIPSLYRLSLDRAANGKLLSLRP